MTSENVQFSTPHDAYAESHVGGRERNEGYATIHGNLFIVADGIGQLFGSDVASREGVRTFIETYHKFSTQTERGKTEQNLYKAVQAANQRMRDLARHYKAKQMAVVYLGGVPKDSIQLVTVIVDLARGGRTDLPPQVRDSNHHRQPPVGRPERVHVRGSHQLGQD